MVEEPTSVRSVDVSGNRWTDLTLPELALWSPATTVSVVIPAYQAQAALNLTLAGLAGQHYPTQLVEVLVVDDGSEPPLRQEVDLPFTLRILQQAHAGFGAGRARRLGAAAADGDMILFLDADMVLEPFALAAHARWHEHYDAVLTLGHRQHMEFDGICPEDVLLASRTGSLAPITACRQTWEVEWIERWLDRTNNLTQPRLDVWRVTSAGNMSVRRRLYEEVGGFYGLGQRGVEDTELGYRLFTAGALVVPDRQAAGWHQGRSHFQSESAEATKEERTPFFNRLIPVDTFRPLRPGRTYALPAVRVHVVATAADSAVTTVDAVLASSWTDVSVCLEVEDDDLLAKLQVEYGQEPRVSLQAGCHHLGEVPYTATPVQVWLPEGVSLGRDSLAAARKALLDVPLGAVHLTVPRAPADSPLVYMALSRAIFRAQRLSTNRREVEQLIGRQFGERWLSGAALGVNGLPQGDVASSPIDRLTETAEDAAMREAWRAIVARSVGKDAVVAVITRGDDRLLTEVLGPLRGGHFPQTPQGVYVGHHPADDVEAILALQTLQSRGFDHLLVPAPYLWWLEHYAQFADYLSKEAQPVFHQEDLGTLYVLGDRPRMTTHFPTADVRPRVQSALSALLPARRMRRT